MVNVRRLAAVDLSGLGPRIIIPEFAVGVLGAPALGVLTVLRSQSLGMTAFGIALIGLGVNYIPLLIHAIELVRRSAVEAAIADEACDRRALYAKYRRQSLWLLFPFAVGFAALLQMRQHQSR
ncbi:MAG TPA: hypothetical protein VKE51_14890 [Vicinamibacterales bacterium]|nr:hypothetical protein [Vicinamibacterales bacterium]